MAVFEYKKRETLLHRLSPLIKIYVMIGSVILMFAGSQRHVLLLPFLVWLLMLVTLLILAKTELRKFARLWRTLAIVFAILLLMQGFLYRYSETVTPLFTVGHLEIAGRNIGVFTLEGLMVGLMGVLKVLCIVFSTVLLITTTPVHRLASIMSKVKLPHSISVMVLMTFEFTGLVEDTFHQIMEAQQLRGFDIEQMNFVKKIRELYPALVVPLVLTLLRRGLTTQMVLESRAFGAPGKKTPFEEITVTMSDYLVCAIVTVVLVVSIGLGKYSIII